MSNKAQEMLCKNDSSAFMEFFKKILRLVPLILNLRRNSSRKFNAFASFIHSIQKRRNAFIRHILVAKDSTIPIWIIPHKAAPKFHDFQVHKSRLTAQRLFRDTFFTKHFALIFKVIFNCIFVM